MAYVSQDLKAKLAPQIKAVLKKYGMKGTIAVRNHMTLVVNLKAGKLDLIGNYNETVNENPRFKNDMRPREVVKYMDINRYWYHEHFTGECKAFLDELLPAMMTGNHDNSDIMTDYFDVGWYVDINVGQWDKPYELVK